jgi:hypothetical protein
MCGSHRFWMEAPDLLCMTMHGDLHLPAAEAYMRLVEELGERYGTFVFLVDMRDIGDIGPGVRSRLARVGRPYPYRAIAVYGASFAVRILSTTIIKAGRGLAPFAFPFEVGFFRTEHEARFYLARFRDPPKKAR